MQSTLYKTISTHPNLFIVLPLILAAGWIAFTAIAFPATTEGGIPAPQEGFLSPDFSLHDFDGQVFQLSDFRGQPVLVNFWATWCPPCREEMPAMQEVFTEYQGQGFTILAVNATHQDSQANALAFIQKYRLSFPVLVDLDGSVTRQYQVHSFPTSFFIDSNGTIQEVIIGGPMAEALLRTRVEKLIAGDQ